MRDLLICPDFSMQAIDETHEVLVTLKEAILKGAWCEVRDNGEDEVWGGIKQGEMWPVVERLYCLIGKEVSLFRLRVLMQSYSTRVVSALLLQERAPAVFDISFEEVVEVLKRMYQQERPLHQKIYYQELLQKSLLLTQINEVLPSFVDVGAVPVEMDVIKGWAKRLFEKSKEVSEIIVF